MSIEVKNVTKLYGEQKALNNVSFTINSGEIVGFLGPNGAGKSTMMKIITGFIPPSEGTVFVNGMNILDNPVNVSRVIGYLPESNPLYLEMYVKEYLEYVAGLYKIRRGKKERVQKIVDQIGLTPEVTKKIGALSKGYRQRVGLAQALLHEPEVLVLDEPTSGLDPNQIVEIRNIISEIGRKKTVMLSTHIMQEVEAICDRVIIIKKGELVADNATDKIQTEILDNHQTVIVEFNRSVTKKQLMQIEGVDNVANTDDKNWLLQSPSEGDLRELVFKFAVKNDLTVLSMQRKEKRLEEVFQELTKE
ncbi:MAG: gliding motility-associated ABC transporter ATP-binding subunit GldA [Marinilabiliales bacterium]|nr:MAG: gliding motility-associated ABC transporter ATP-binding subunit GldA [Marinilabiliales bacterium]